MSGICGVWRQGDHAASSAALELITGGLRMRPTESVRMESDGEAGLGLASCFESQQIYPGKRVIVACDAALSNARNLAELAQIPPEAPPCARTAALLAALYERFGERFVELLEGSFAVVLWDRKKKRLVAAIDGFGIKRLVHYHDGERIFISSRIDALMRSGEVAADINPRAIPNILNFTANLAPETIYRRVERLPPGTILIAEEGRVALRSYWDIRYDDSAGTRLNDLAHNAVDVVAKSVANCCKDRQFNSLGAFLSGGTDSSAVVGLMSRLGTVNAFSIGFQEESFNELGYAELAAKKFGAAHHTYLVGPEDCFQALNDMVRYFDEPFGNSSAIPTYFCARLAAQHGVTNLLAGDGGDELFGGNEHYRIDKIFNVYHSLPRFLRRSLIEPTLSLPLGNGLASKARRYVRRAKLPGAERMLSFQFLSTHSPADVFEGGFLEKLRGYTIADIPRRHYRAASAEDHLNRLLYLDMKITLADNDLPKVTVMAELAGITPQFPYLSKQVVEFCAGIPAKYKLNGFEKRYLFKQAFRSLLPREIIAKKKHGFGIPVANWLKTDPKLRELARDTLSSSRFLARGYFRREFLEKIFNDHESDDSTYYGDTLWTLLALELWHIQSVDKASGARA